MTERVKADSLVTLHYRVATADGVELIATFGTTPAVLQLGSGELAPPLEQCLIDLPVGEHHTFLLDAQQAFGPHNPELQQRIARAELPANAEVELHSLIEFAAPNGDKFAGLVRELDNDSALIDFNHPLAGKAIRFEVEIIGLL